MGVWGVWVFRTCCLLSPLEWPIIIAGSVTRDGEFVLGSWQSSTSLTIRDEELKRTVWPNCLQVSVQVISVERWTLVCVVVQIRFLFQVVHTSNVRVYRTFLLDPPWCMDPPMYSPTKTQQGHQLMYYFYNRVGVRCKTIMYSIWLQKSHAFNDTRI